MDDDDEFLYGPSTTAPKTESKSVSLEPEPNPVPTRNSRTPDEVLDFLDDDAQPEQSPTPKQEPSNGVPAQPPPSAPVQEEEDDEEEAIDSGDDSDEDDIEFILEAPNRSLDLRNQNRPQAPRAASSSLPPNLPTAPRAAGLSLTTEYTPMARGGPPPGQVPPQVEDAVQAATSVPSQNTQTNDAVVDPVVELEPDDGIDTSTLPLATAPPGGPTVDASAVGVFNGQSILEVDLSTLADKPWRRPGSDLSDWFNYGFDELSWEAYCHLRRDIGDLATTLKANVINFSAMPEEQLVALPPEIRTMVMQGTTTMMNNAASAGMMGPGVMMDMAGMMGPMGMGMNGDMAAMGGGMMQGIMPTDTAAQGQAPGGVGVAGQGQEQVGMMQDASGFAGQAAGQGMMNMGMGGDFVMQEQNPIMQPQMFMDGSAGVQGGRGGAVPAGPSAFRGRGTPANVPPRGRGTFASRGRGRGGIFSDPAPPIAPARPASPLPPNVPTGPRNQNKYKDRDGNAPAVDGLDYGGGRDPRDTRDSRDSRETRDRDSRDTRESRETRDSRDTKEPRDRREERDRDTRDSRDTRDTRESRDAAARRTSSGEPEERVSSRKRRSSPGFDDIRGSKRR